MKAAWLRRIIKNPRGEGSLISGHEVLCATALRSRRDGVLLADPFNCFVEFSLLNQSMPIDLLEVVLRVTA
jgi:hypothetical protein